MSNYFCPYCLEDDDRNTCTKNNKEIPKMYKEAIDNGAEIYPILLAGQTQRGKSTYILSLIYSLASKLPKDIASVITISQDSIDKAREVEKTLLKQRAFPSATTRPLDEPLILKLKKANGQEVILLIFDTKGGIHDKISELQAENILKGMINIIFLVDFETLNRENNYNDGAIALGLCNNLQALLNYYANDYKKINIALCLTKMDKVWGNTDYGILANKDNYPDTKNKNLKDYFKEMGIFSDKIELFLQKRDYNNFLDIITKEFGGYGFFSSSNIGSKVYQENNKQTFETFNPIGVIDPILWLINND